MGLQFEDCVKVWEPQFESIEKALAVVGGFALKEQGGGWKKWANSTGTSLYARGWSDGVVYVTVSHLIKGNEINVDLVELLNFNPSNKTEVS